MGGGGWEGRETRLFPGGLRWAGAPAAGASAQVVVAFVDREGGSFFQEWSALFVAEEESGGRVCFYYPRLSAGRVRNAAGKVIRGGVSFVEKPMAGSLLWGLFFWVALTRT